MKKILCMFLLMCFLFILAGCYKSYYKDPDVGTYFSKKIESESSEFTSCRMEIKKIISAQYEKAEGINVYKTDSNDSNYFRFEIYLFSTTTNQEELVSLSDIQFNSNKFYGDANLKILDKEYRGYFDLDYQNRNTSVSIFDYDIDFYLYRNDLMQGQLISLNDAYQNGFITHQDLQQIAYQYNQVNYKGEIDYGDEFIPVPKPVAMDDLTNESIRYAWCKGPNSIDSKTGSKYKSTFYGYYHDYYAVSYADSDYLRTEKHIIDDVTFYNYTEVYLWKEFNELVQGKIRYLFEAYDKEWITHEDLKQIAYMYNQRNSDEIVDYGSDFKPKEYLSPTLNQVICDSIKADYEKKHNPFNKTFVVNPQHYGIYGKCYVVAIDFSNETGGCGKAIVDGVTFYNYDGLYIWSPDASKK